MPGSNLVYLAVAFAVTWIGIFGYLFVLNRTAARLAEELQALAASREGAGAPPA
ncbi:MAG TPA: CcmD family protein [Chloroflexota bacterium]|jgi:CcmD family protein